MGWGLGLNHGAPQEPPSNLSAPTVLYDWLVAGHGSQPVVVFSRGGLARGAEAAQLLPLQTLQCMPSVDGTGSEWISCHAQRQ